LTIRVANGPRMLSTLRSALSLDQVGLQRDIHANTPTFSNTPIASSDASPRSSETTESAYPSKSFTRFISLLLGFISVQFRHQLPP